MKGRGTPAAKAPPARKAGAAAKPGSRKAGAPTAAKGPARRPAKRPVKRAAGGGGAAGKAPGAGPKAARARGRPSRTTVAAPARPQVAPGEGLDPEGYFIARVRGEEAVRHAPHPMAEADEPEDAATAPAEGPGPDDEGLGDLPFGYGDDALVGLPRDPQTLFLYWDHARASVERALEGLDHPRTQLWVSIRGAGGEWHRMRAVDFALESRSHYVHDLEPGRVYRAEIHVVDARGGERRLGNPSNEVQLPPRGASPVVDDRFARIPWDLPLDRAAGEARSGGAFPEDLRAQLARLSDWSRFGGGARGSSAGGMVGRPASPAGGFGGGGGKEGS